MAARIGVDIDAVLTKEGRGKDNIWYQEVCDYFDLDSRRKPVYDFRQAYDLSDEQIKQFMEARITDIYTQLPVAPQAKKVLTKLKETGFKIILITARNKQHRDLTLNWLEDHNLPFHKLIHSKNKGKSCRKEEIDLFIDDNLNNLLAIKSELDIPLLIMDMDHNQDYHGPIPRVNNWQEIKVKLNQIFNNRLEY